jgi:hypothetical protein
MDKVTRKSLPAATGSRQDAKDVIMETWDKVV